MKRSSTTRQKHSGRFYVASGGAPNQPLACMVSDGIWSKADDFVGWLVPQVLLHRSAWFASKDHASLCDWIESDLQEWRDQHPARKTLPVTIIIDTSQAPAVLSIFNRLNDASTAIEGFKLTANDSDPILARKLAPESQALVGAHWLISWFNAKVAKSLATETKYGSPYVPDRVVMLFDRFDDGEPPMMTKDEIRSSMSGAERLMKRVAKADSESLLDLSADEIVATVVMLTLLAAEQFAPAEIYQPDGIQPFRPMSDDDRQELHEQRAIGVI
jgi:hypothetical protein